MKYTIGLFLVGVIAGAASSVFILNDNPEYLPSVTKLAITNGCGGYGHDDGKFSWEHAMTLNDFDIPVIKAKASEPSGISITSLPKPMRKPAVPVRK